MAFVASMDVFHCVQCDLKGNAAILEVAGIAAMPHAFPSADSISIFGMFWQIIVIMSGSILLIKGIFWFEVSACRLLR